MGRAPWHFVFRGGETEDRMGYRVYCLRRLEEDSEILGLLWPTWHGQVNGLESYPEVVCGIYDRIRREGVGELEQCLRDRGLQAQSARCHPARRRSLPLGGERPIEFD